MTGGEQFRFRPERERAIPGAGDSPSGALDSIRQQARDVSTAADRAIDRVLSGDSEQYLRAIRQQGGQ